jgi:signal transduction histidine kinase
MDLARVWSGFTGLIRRHPVLSDAALGLATAVAVVGANYVLDFDTRTTRELGLADVAGFLLAILVVAARRFIVAALVACAGFTFVFLVFGHDQPALTAAFAVLFYTYAVRTDRRGTWLTAVTVSGVLIGGGLIGDAPLTEGFGSLTWIAIGAAVGDATRSRRAYTAEVEQRVRQAEQSRDEEVRLRVAEERIRIARELHDLVAHHIAAVKVQATGARHILTHRPEQVGPALEHISRSTDMVLKEMASVVALLRTGDSQDRAPAYGLAQLPGLLDAVAATGLHVEVRHVGTARELPELIDLAAYRIVQEGLTNAQKHGDGVVDLTLSYAPGAVTVDVTNHVGDKPAEGGTGFGVIGMSERVAAHGGRFSAGPTGDGRYAVRAQLPTPAGEAAR